jgi:hypothetical protein
MTEYGPISQETEYISPLAQISDLKPYGEEFDEIEDEDKRYENFTPCSEIELSDEEREDRECDDD